MRLDPLALTRPPKQGPPPQCITCSRFVNVKTAKAWPDMGEYGVVYGYEFECARCVEDRSSQRKHKP